MAGKTEQFKLHLYPELPQEEPTIYLDKIKVGHPSVQIVEEIADNFPEIKKFMYIIYDPWLSSSDEDDNFPNENTVYKKGIILNADLNKKNLLSISDKFFKKDRILGMASKIKMKDGSFAHIPMMDFGCEVKEENLDMIEKLMTPFHGFILESGNSYHFWGNQPMPEAKWVDFLNYCGEKGEDLIESNYIDACKNRGFCVLRIFSYSDSNVGILLKKEPKVVRVLK